jgi:hypothetical protein
MLSAQSIYHRFFSKPIYVLFPFLCAVALLSNGCSGGLITLSFFNWTVNPGRRTVARGQQTTFRIRIDSKENINSNVNLNVSGLPANTTATFSPQRLGSTGRNSTLTVQTTNQTPIGTFTITISATEVGFNTHTFDRLLFVTETGGSEPDFSLEVNPLQHTFEDFGVGPTFTYFVRPLNGFSGTVDVSLSGLTDDLLLAQAVTPPSVGVNVGGHAGAGGTFVLYALPTPPVQTPVFLTVTATGGGITHTAMIRIDIRQ